MKKTVIAFAFASIAASALAQPPGGGFTPPTFEGLDADKNGSLTQDEVAKFFAGRAPPGGGGGGGGPNVADIFGRWDANKDGSVSKAEFDARPRQGGGGPPGGPPPGSQPPR